MSAFRHAWESLASWVSPPLQVGLAFAVALLIITKIAPRIIRGCGMALRGAWAPLLELLTYPEFLITTASRQMSGQPLPGTYAYGRILGTLALPGTRLGGWLASRRKAVRFPWKTTLLVIAILTSCWYLAPKIPASGAQTVLANVNTDDVHVNTWLTTGRWVPAAPARTCIAAAALTHRRPHRKRRHHHPK